MQNVYLTGPDIRIPDAQRLYKIKQDLLTDHNLQGHCSLDLVCANLTPFRGVSADTCTIWELGYAYSKQKPIFAYAATNQIYVERVQQTWMLQRQSSGVLCDGLGYLVEDFGGVDSLMLDACVVGTIITGPWIGDLTAMIEFERICHRMQHYR